MRHVIWDWNGTLFDDLDIVVAAVNASLDDLGAERIGHDDYRTHYGRPVVGFYERLLGRAVSDREWLRIDEVFHDAYRSRLEDAEMARDARAALEAVAAAGGSQSLLSMWWHDELVPFVARFGVERYLVRIDGHRGGPGETKRVHLERHLAALEEDAGLAAGDVLLVGDALDDAVAARQAGVLCVLYDGGSHHRPELDAAGCPVVDTLVDAVRAVGIQA